MKQLARPLSDDALAAWDVRRLALAALIMLAGWALWPSCARPFSAAFRAAANGSLGATTFGRGGHAAFLPASRTVARPSSSRVEASWDTAVELRIDGVDKRHRVRMNPRRLAYLPLCLFAALVLAARLAPRRKAICLLPGLLALIVVAHASVWITVSWLFARVPGLVYDLSGFESALLAFAYEALVTSPANKFVCPILLAAALVVWQRSRALSRRIP
jgi:hypothetical protein